VLSAGSARCWERSTVVADGCAALLLVCGPGFELCWIYETLFLTNCVMMARWC
jgi:hypothetical protein